MKNMKGETLKMSEKHILTKNLKEAEFYVLQSEKGNFITKSSYGRNPLTFPDELWKDTLIWDSYSECSKAKRKLDKIYRASYKIVRLLSRQLKKQLMSILGTDVKSILNGDITDKVIVVDPTKEMRVDGYLIKSCKFFIQNIDEYNAIKQKEKEKAEKEAEERKKLKPLAEDLVYLIQKYDPYHWDYKKKYDDMKPVDIVLMNRNKGHQISITKKAYGDSYDVPIEEVFTPRELDELHSLCDKLGYKLDNWVQYY